MEILERARHGQALDPADIGVLAGFWIDGIATDTQMAAWCTSPAAVNAGLDVARELSGALLSSGRRLEPSSLGPTVDLQMTGGVGDASMLVAVPVAAALGAVPLVLAGGEREHFGAALTKLGAVPGFSADLDARGVLRSVRDGGAVIAGAGPELVPAAARLDRLLASVGGSDSPALVAAQMTARSLAAGVGSSVIVTSYGPGGAFTERGAARACAEMITSLLTERGRRVRWCTSACASPLGPAVGTALEIAAAGAVLRGEARGEMSLAACEMAGVMAEAAGAMPEGEGVRAASEALADGQALAAAEKWIEAQGGDATVWTDVSRVAQAPHEIAVAPPSGGVLTGIDARAVGLAVRSLGAGRLHESQGIDFSVGVTLHADRGSTVALGDEIARVHSRDPGLGDAAAAAVAAAVSIDGPDPTTLAQREWGSGSDA